MIHVSRETYQECRESQGFGTVRRMPIGLSHDTRRYACRRLNRLLADTQMLFALYKKHHRLVRGATFHQLHVLLDKHADEQLALVDALAERVQALGDDGSNDLIVSSVIRTGEVQAWFLTEHRDPPAPAGRTVTVPPGSG
ncbi:Dps family protein [Actinomadura nitritigenes]|uniref:Dps family protein n=1 Tax=Actinomadura nitritigenes TaxID=134602 RepID=UPI003D8D4838